MVSGGFDPPHIGHIRMFKEASKWGKVIVALNSDEWLMRKKGYVFMTFKERLEIISEFASIDYVMGFDDKDNTACDAIFWRTNEEENFCERPCAFSIWVWRAISLRP